VRLDTTSNPNDINAEYYDTVYDYIKGREVTDAECLLIMSLIGKEKGSILDIGAGTGRHTLELAKRGYKLTAIDSSKEMLAKLLKANSEVNVQATDVFSFLENSTEKFDAIIMMWNTFNEIALTKKEARDLLRELKSNLSANGFILINMDKPTLNKPFKPEFYSSQEVKGQKVLVSWTNVKYAPRTRTTVSKEQLQIGDKTLMPALITQRWWSKSEVRAIAKEAGFKVQNYPLKCNNEYYIVISTINAT